eukprot:Awhi_evm1s11217
MLQGIIFGLMAVSQAASKMIVKPEQCTMPSMEEYYADNVTPHMDPIGKIDIHRKKNDPIFWENGIVYYEIDPEIEEQVKQDIFNAFTSIKERLNDEDRCITFKETNNDSKNFIYFASPDVVGCNSFVGKVGGKQRINLRGKEKGQGCGVIPTVHQIFHALGFHHVHSRADRDQYVHVYE